MAVQSTERTGTGPQRSPADRAVIRKVTVRLVPILILLNFVNYVDRVNVGFAATPLSNDLALTSAAYGLGAGIFFIGYFLFEVPSNVMMHRLGARVWLTRIILSWGLVVIGTAFVQGERSFIAVRFLLGVAEAGFFPGILFYLTYWFPARERARVFSLFFLSVPLATVLGAPLSALILQYVRIGDIEPWRVMFFVEGLPAVTLAFVVIKYLPSRPAGAHWLTPDEADRLALIIEKDRAATRASKAHVRGRDVLKNPRVLGLIAVFFGIIYGFYAISFFLTKVIEGLQQRFGTHYSPFEVGLITAIPCAFATIAMLLWSRHSDRTGERAWHVALPCLVGALGVGVALHLGSVFLIVGALSVAAVGIYSAIPPFWQIPTLWLTEAAAAVGLALVNSIGNLAGFAAPYLTGWIHDATGGFETAMFVISGALVGAAVLVVAIAPRRRAEPTPPEVLALSVPSS
ncbi:MFS transporter [Streptomyces eurythermus]|uniref:MFS transporter n=1 Tax=Streptomyces eurythermus TaxID=42237 RepID=UPI0034002CC5